MRGAVNDKAPVELAGASGRAMTQHATSLTRGLIALAATVAASAALGQTRADGAYPATIFCEQLPFTAGPARDRFSVEIAGGKARYTRKLTAADAPEVAGAVESGGGALAGRTLSIATRATGKAASFEARYSGEVDGRGGLLTGLQVWKQGGKTHNRRCQVTLGDGR